MNQLYVCVLSHFSWVQLFGTLWTVAHLSMGLSGQEYWSGLPCPPPGDLSDLGLNPHLLYFLHCRQILQRRQWHPTPVLLPGKSHGWRSLVGCSPRGCWESDTTEWLHFDFSLSCIGERNGNPLQYSCLENPRDGGAWWAAVYGVAQSRTQLKRLSCSSSSRQILYPLNHLGSIHPPFYRFSSIQFPTEH